LAASDVVYTQTHGDTEGMSGVYKCRDETVASFWTWRAAECSGYYYRVAGLETAVRTEI
jgi:hypothetical protein